MGHGNLVSKVFLEEPLLIHLIKEVLNSHPQGKAYLGACQAAQQANPKFIPSFKFSSLDFHYIPSNSSKKPEFCLGVNNSDLPILENPSQEQLATFRQNMIQFLKTIGDVAGEAYLAAETPSSPTQKNTTDTTRRPVVDTELSSPAFPHSHLKIKIGLDTLLQQWWNQTNSQLLNNVMAAMNPKDRSDNKITLYPHNIIFNPNSSLCIAQDILHFYLGTDSKPHGSSDPDSLYPIIFTIPQQRQ